jgi:hypothetical protein
MYEGIPSYSLRLYTGILGWKKEDVDKRVAEVQSILKDRSVHIYTMVHFVFAQKPEYAF